MGIFSFLAGPLGIAMRWLYTVVGNYGWAIIIFTFLVRIVLFPLGLKQQKSTARMTAFQPMIQEIQKKWANDKNRQNQELQKFYEENNISMSGGCAPTIVNMLVLFGIIGVIQAPLVYILQTPQEQVDNGIAIVQYYEPDGAISGAQAYTQQSMLVGAIKENPQIFVDGITVEEDGLEVHKAMDYEHVEAIKDFNFEFMGLNLASAPAMKFDRYLIMPILSLLTMVASQIIIMKTSGQPGQGRGQMLIMTVIFSGMFAFIAFRVPVGFSLYYTASNIVQTIQQIIVRRIHNPEKVRAEVEKEMEERRAQKKAKKKVVVRQDDEVVELDVNDGELARMRLERARKLDAERYGGDDDEGELSEEQKAKAELAQQQDKEAYGMLPPQKKKKAKDEGDASDSLEDGEEVPAAETDEAPDAAEPEAPAEEKGEDMPEAPAENEAAPAAEAPEAAPPAEAPAAPQADAAAEYKPGRRKRATTKKKEPASFAEKERAAEQAQDDQGEGGSDA
ncbi:membrane protein insertase YidC [Ruminococcaceae bacterium OttesenSCG-928-O06]|nr:membrane protein insertase YidC [Ruminococcaceae bacterium OttesenSCG-928-O06]